MIYWVNLGVLILAAFFTEIIPINEIKRCKRYVFVGCALYLYFFVSLRVDTGYDYESYKNIYYGITKLNLIQLIKESNYFTWIEPGYVFLNFLCKPFGFRGFLFVVTGVTMLPKLIFFRKYSDHYITVLMIYYCTIMLGFDMGVLRQGIATGICFWAFAALKENNKSLYLVIACIAIMFHSASTILIFLLLFDMHRKYKNIWYLLVIVVAFACSFCHPISIIQYLLSHISSFLSYKLYVYVSSYRDPNDTSMAIYLSVIKRLLVFIPLMLFIDWNKVEPSTYIGKSENILCVRKNNTFFVVLFNIFFLSIVLSLLFSELPVLGGRGTGVLQSAQLFLLPALCNSKNLRFKSSDELSVTANNCAFYCYVLVMVIYNMFSTINEEEFLRYCSVLGC